MYIVRVIDQNGGVISNRKYILESSAILEMSNYIDYILEGNYYKKEGYTLISNSGSIVLRIYILDTEGWDEDSN